MKLKPGCAEEYKRRHANLWPEIAQALREAGISEYSIFLDEETETLFAIQTLAEGNRAEALVDHPAVRRWWNSMACLMETHPDDEPIAVKLKEMFYLK